MLVLYNIDTSKVNNNMTIFAKIFLGGEKMANEDIRKSLKINNIKYWQVANEYGITDGNFSRKLRKELSSEEKKKIFNIIDKLIKK